MLFRSGSSSSPDRSSSPFAFGNTRLDAYNAPSSPFLLPTLSASPCKPLLTPSSPSASFLPSSPIATKSLLPLVLDFPTAEDALTLGLERGNVFQFGRKGKKVQPNHSAGETTLPILLPRSAKNASRLHCTVRILPSEGSRIIVEVRVLGQNGMKVDGILWPAGSVAVLTRPAGATLELSFWGWTSFVIVAESEKAEKKKVVKVVSRFIPVAATPARSPSPALSFNSLFDDDLSVDEVAVAHTLSAPLYSDPASLPTSSSAIEATSPRRASSPAESTLSALSSSPVRENSLSSTRATSLVSSLGLDLAGLIASVRPSLSACSSQLSYPPQAIVFHPRSTVGVEEVVKALLNEVGGMWSILEGGKGEGAQREEAAVEAWWDVVESVMQEEAFFGCIENAGLRVRPSPSSFSFAPDEFWMAGRSGEPAPTGVLLPP